MAINKKKVPFLAAAGMMILLTGWLLPSLLLNSDAARQWAETSINTRISGTVRISDHHLSLAGRQLKISGLSLSAADGRPIIDIEMFQARIRLLPLLKKTIKIKSVLVENTRGRLRLDPDGTLDLINAFLPPSPPSSPVDPDNNSSGLLFNIIMPREVVVTAVQLNDTRIRYESDREEMEILGTVLSFSGRTSLAEPAAQAVLRGEDIRLDLPQATLILSTLDFEARLDKGDIHELTLQAEGESGFLHLTGGIQRVFSDPMADLHLKSDLDLKKIQILAGIDQELSGHASINLDMSGSFLSPLIQADLVLQKAVLGPAHIDSLQCRLDISDQAATIAPLTIVSGDGRVTATGKISLAEVFPKGFFGGEQNPDNLTYAFNIHSESFDPIPLVGSMLTGKRGLKGTVQSSLKLSGRGIHPDRLTAAIIGEIEVRDFKDTMITTPVSAAFGIDAEWKSAGLRLNRLTGRAAGVDINGSGHYSLREKNIAARIELKTDQIGPAASLFGRDEFSGTLDLEADVTGTFPDLHVKSTFQSDHLAFAPVTIGDVDGHVVLSGGALSLTQLTIHQGDSYCRTTGTLRLWDEATGAFIRNPPFSLKIHPSIIYPADLLADGRQGKIMLSGELSGLLLNPEGNFVIRGEGLDMEIMTADVLNIKAALENDAFRILALEATFPDDQTILGTGRIAWNRTYQFNLSSSKTFLSLIKPIRESDRVDGTAGFDVSGHGDWWEIPRLDGIMNIDHFTLAGMPLKEMAVVIEFTDHSAEIAVHNDAEITGLLNLTDMTFSAQANFEQTALKPFFSLANQPDISGFLTGRLKAEGQLTDPDSIKAAAAVTHLTLFHQQHQWIQASPFRLDYNDGMLNIPGIRLAVAESGMLNLSGRIGLDRSILLKIQGEAPMAPAGIFTPDLYDITGNLLLDADVYGTLDNPDITGWVKLAGIGMSLSHIHQKLEDINGIIHFQAGKMDLEGISGRLGNGQFLISGDAALDGLIPTAMSIQLQAEEIPVSIPDVMDVRLNVDLAFIKTDVEEVIRGEIIILDGIYHRDVHLIGYTDIIRAPFQRQKKRELPPTRQLPLPPFLGDMSLDLLLTHRLPFKIDNNLALLEIFPDLSIRGTLNRPIILGQARTGSGEVFFYRKTFVLERGVVDFSNPYKTEPYIDITGTAQISEWRITLSLVGPLDRLQVELTSDPYESTDNILSLLVFGRPSRDLADQDAAGKTPSQMVAELVTATFSEDIKTITGLDIVEMSAREDARENTYGQTTITVGSKLTDRLTLKHSFESSQGILTQVTASEYQLTENTTISGYQSDRGGLGGRLIYRLEFR